MFADLVGVREVSSKKGTGSAVSELMCRERELVVFRAIAEESLYKNRTRCRR